MILKGLEGALVDRDRRTLVRSNQTINASKRAPCLVHTQGVVRGGPV
jgi:hypothetical protein